MGCQVIATASTDEKLQVAKEYGADYCINYSKKNFKDEVKEITNGNGADIIYDPVGGEVFNQSLRCIAWNGRLLVELRSKNRNTHNGQLRICAQDLRNMECDIYSILVGISIGVTSTLYVLILDTGC